MKFKKAKADKKQAFQTKQFNTGTNIIFKWQKMPCHKVNIRVKMDKARQINMLGHHTVDSGVQGNKEVRTVF